MNDPDVSVALARIERALGRLEKAATAATAKPAADPALARRHERLRGTVEDALARLDALLAEEAA